MIGRNSSIAPRFLRSNDQSEDTTGNPWEGWSSVTETHGQNPREYLDRIFSGDQFDLLETDKDSQFPGGFLQKYTIPADTVLQLLNLTLEGGYVGAQVYTERPRAIRSPIDIVLLHYPGSVCVGIRPGTPPQPSTPVSLNMSHYFPASNLIEQQLDQIFLAARQERFETGMGSQFSTNLQQLYEIDPYTVLQSLRERLARLEVCPEVLAENADLGFAAGASRLRRKILGHNVTRTGPPFFAGARRGRIESGVLR